MRSIQVAKGRPHYYSTRREEYAHIKFTLDMDLSSLYTWNTKQVFVYITATYPSHDPTAPPNKAIIWDAILPSRLESWHQNQYIHSTAPPANNRRRTSSNRIYKSYDVPGKLKLKGQKPKYVITDHTGMISDRSNATLELGWNVQPWVGVLLWKQPKTLGLFKKLEGGVTEAFDIPPLKGAEKPPGMDTARGGEGNRGKPA